MSARDNRSRGPGSSGNASSRPLAFYIILGAIAIVGVGFLAWTALRPSGGGDRPPPQMGADLANAGPAQGYRNGNDSAPVQIVEFADFECPSCARFAAVTEPDVRARIVERGLANFTYFDFPLPQHRNSYAASHSAACADEQGRFWQMHDLIYAGQDRWSTGATSDPKREFHSYAEQAGLDLGRWEECYDSRRSQKRIDGNAAEGIRRGVNSTPTFFINGRRYVGSTSYDGLKAAVDSAAAAGRASGAAPSPK